MNTETEPNENLSLRILEKIQKEKITPKKKGYFAVRDGVLWLPGIIVTTIGGFAWAGMFFNSTHSSHAYKDFIRPPEIPFIIKELPLIWVFFFLVFILFVIKAVRQTKNGYRYTATQILAISLSLSIAMGLLLFTLDMKYKNPLVRMPTERIQKQLWFNPKEGRMFGTFYINNKNEGYLKDIEGKEWIIYTESLPEIDRVLLYEGRPIRVIGRIENGNSFFACIVLPGNLEKQRREPRKPLPVKKEEAVDEKCKTVIENIKRERSERKLIPSS